MKKKLATPTCRQIINSFPDPFVIIGRDYKIISANSHYADHYGLSADALNGKHCYQVSHHLDSPCSEHGEHCPLEEMFRSGEEAQVIHVHYDSDGNEERVQINATPLYDENGELQFMGETVTFLPNIAVAELIVGHSQSMQLLLQQIKRVAPTRTTVLLTGESGTGKNCMAEYVHSCSGREEKPFVVVDCAALASSEVERELFGFERDNISGSNKIAKGVFERASGGTVFIDEIGELPLASQNKLLRILETGEIKRIGASEYLSIDVRIIVASNSDLQKMVSQGDFRKDLYYRLSAFPVCIPPLRARQADILMLAEYFLKKLDLGGVPLELNDVIKRSLLSHNYPGNVRELRNLLERAVIYAAGEALHIDHFVFDHELMMGDVEHYISIDEENSEVEQEGLDFLSRQGARPSDQKILKTLAECDGYRAEAAKQLGISERTLYRHIKRLRSK